MTAFDPDRALRTLTEASVRFVVIGGVAGAAHGSPSVTQDLDICPDREMANLERLAEVLASWRATLRGADDDVPFVLDGRTLLAGDHFTFATDVGDLDVLGTPAGTEGFADLARTAQSVELDGYSVLMASLDDLIRMKRAAGRPKDRAEVEILGALAEETGEGR